MCGIVGYAGVEPANKTEIQRLIMMSGTRGEHSTGYSADNVIVKEAISPRDFIKKHEIPETNRIIAHTRYATVGAKTMQNAHPYQFGDIIGTHNGSLSTVNFSDLKRNENVTFEVDSQMIYYLIYKYGLDEALPKMEGLFALAWYNINNQDLHLYRAHDRPLFIGWKGENLYYGSIEKYLVAIGCVGIKELKEFTEYVYSNGVLTERFVNKKPRKKPKDFEYYGSYGSYGSRTHVNMHQSKTKLTNLGFTEAKYDKDKHVFTCLVKDSWYDFMFVRYHYIGAFKTGVTLLFSPAKQPSAYTVGYERFFGLPLNAEDKLILESIDPIILTLI